MTLKQVRYDRIVPPKMKVRGIRRPDVRWLLAHGTPIEVFTKSGERRLGKEGEVRGRSLRVIYFDRADHIYVVSVHPIITKAEQERRKP